MAVAAPPRRARAPAPAPRRAGVALDPHGRVGAGEPPLPRRAHTVALFAVAAIAYAVAGTRLVGHLHVIDPDGVARLARAFMAWHDDPAKLSAIGFGAPPLPTLVLMPLGAVTALATSLTALPVTGALLGAAALVLVDRTLARCAVRPVARLVLLVAVALQPIWVLTVVARPAGALELALLALLLHALVGWYAVKEPRHLLAAGVALGLLAVTRYGTLTWAVLLVALVGTALAHRRASRAEIEGSVLALAAPVVYAIATWTLAGAVIVRSPFGWIPGPGAASAAGLGAGHAAARVLALTADVAPLALVVVPALVVAAVARRDHLALWLAALGLAVLVLTGAHAWSAGDPALLSLRAALPVLLVAVAGAGWLHRSVPPARIGIWLVTAGLLAAGVVAGWHAMSHDASATASERAFVAAVRTGDDQRGLADERTVAGYVRRHGAGADRVLADEGEAGDVILLSGRPAAFLDRADRGDAAWSAVLGQPHGRVGWLLLSAPGAGHDRVAQRWGPAIAAGDPSLPVVLRTRRWVLARVAP